MGCYRVSVFRFDEVMRYSLMTYFKTPWESVHPWLCSSLVINSQLTSFKVTILHFDLDSWPRFVNALPFWVRICLHCVKVCLCFASVIVAVFETSSLFSRCYFCSVSNVVVVFTRHFFLLYTHCIQNVTCVSSSMRENVCFKTLHIWAYSPRFTTIFLNLFLNNHCHGIHLLS